jgi:hypothetical protein
MYLPKNTTGFHGLGVFPTPGVRPMTEVGVKKRAGVEPPTPGKSDTSARKPGNDLFLLLFCLVCVTVPGGKPGIEKIENRTSMANLAAVNPIN